MFFVDLKDHGASKSTLKQTSLDKQEHDIWSKPLEIENEKSRLVLVEWGL